MEVLVVVSIIALLLAILVPSLGAARRQSRATVCLTQLRVLGQGLSMYALQHSDKLPPSRMPSLGDGVNWRLRIKGGLKYRPTFLAIMGSNMGLPPFAIPMRIRASVDCYGEAGDRQNYASEIYVCPEVSHWTDERNGAYGYNYQFLGNSRLRNYQDPTSFKNWPARTSEVRFPSRCVAVADSMGTTASFEVRREYINNSRDADCFGNEGFNLDPPKLDPINGEMANFYSAVQSRTALHARHSQRGSVLWMDSHCSLKMPSALGYKMRYDKVIDFNGKNGLFNINGRDEAWIE
jgi:hypothetical protein